MFDKTISFIACKEYIEFTEIKPEPSKLNIPKWYKDLDHHVEIRTIKGCMPFLDTLTTGYILKLPVDYYIYHNVIKDNERVMVGRSDVGPDITNNITKNINVNPNYPQYHKIDQLGKECPFIKKNKDLPFHKILNPWIIKTPPGYSCLFIPPMNNSDDRFSIIPGIVDTDKYFKEINFPIIINGDKYPVLETILKLGTPYVQVIPFKRDQWKMKIETLDKKKYDQNDLSLHSKVINKYKTTWWHKKSWK
jgi:hypothetical protein